MRLRRLNIILLLRPELRRLRGQQPQRRRPELCQRLREPHRERQRRG
jgi:hypothetical protein